MSMSRCSSMVFMVYGLQKVGAEWVGDGVRRISAEKGVCFEKRVQFHYFWELFPMKHCF